MTPKKLPPGLTPIGELMGETRLLVLGKDGETLAIDPVARPAKRVQLGRREAMLGQRKVKPDAFPVGNRAARRLDKSKKAKERPL